MALPCGRGSCVIVVVVVVVLLGLCNAAWSFGDASLRRSPDSSRLTYNGSYCLFGL